MFSLVFAVSSLAYVQALPLNIESVAMVQKRSETKKASTEIQVNMPSVREMLNGPIASVSAISEHVHTFEATIEAMNQSAMHVAFQDKVNYEGQLRDQASKIMKIQKTNEYTEDDIFDVRNTNRQLRQEAMSLKQDNKELVADIDFMLKNLTIAEEFMASTINQSMARLNYDQARELNVLQDLMDQDANESAYETHRRHLEEIGRFSLLSVKSDTDSPKDILLYLSQAVDNLKTQQNQSQVGMKFKFQQMFHTGEQRFQELIAEQELLNNTQASEYALQTRLQKAVQSLKETKEMLVSRTHALRQFAIRLAGRPLPSGDNDNHRVQTSMLSNKPRVVHREHNVEQLEAQRAAAAPMKEHASSGHKKVATGKRAPEPLVGASQQDHLVKPVDVAAPQSDVAALQGQTNVEASSWKARQQSDASFESSYEKEIARLQASKAFR